MTIERQKPGARPIRVELPSNILEIAYRIWSAQQAAMVVLEAAPFHMGNDSFRPYTKERK